MKTNSGNVYLKLNVPRTRLVEKLLEEKLKEADLNAGFKTMLTATLNDIKDALTRHG